MQVSFRKIVLGSVAAVTLAVPSLAEIKVGVIDYGRLLNESPQAKALTESLDAEFNPRYQQLVTQDRALKAKAEKLQKDLATMTADQRSKAEKEIRDSARELERKGKELKDDSEAKRNEEIVKLQRMLGNEVREYAKAQNFDIVLDGRSHLRDARGEHHRCRVEGVADALSQAGRRAGRRGAAAQAAREALSQRRSRAPPP